MVEDRSVFSWKILCKGKEHGQWAWILSILNVCAHSPIAVKFKVLRDKLTGSSGGLAEDSLSFPGSSCSLGIGIHNEAESNTHFPQPLRGGNKPGPSPGSSWCWLSTTNQHAGYSGRVKGWDTQRKVSVILYSSVPVLCVSLYGGHSCLCISLCFFYTSMGSVFLFLWYASRTFTSTG